MRRRCRLPAWICMRSILLSWEASMLLPKALVNEIVIIY